MAIMQVVLDTCVLYSALKSSKGASHRLIALLDEGAFQNNVSITLVMEYEAVLKLARQELGFSSQEIDDFLDYICKISNRHEVFFLWRPVLRDPKDEMVLEIGVASGASFIITFNKKDFVEAAKFGILVVSPGEFLKIVEVNR